MQIVQGLQAPHRCHHEPDNCPKADDHVAPWAAGRSLHTSPSPSSFRFRFLKRVVAIDLGVDLRRDSNGIERDFVGRVRPPRSPKRHLTIAAASARTDTQACSSYGPFSPTIGRSARMYVSPRLLRV